MDQYKQYLAVNVLNDGQIVCYPVHVDISNR